MTVAYELVRTKRRTIAIVIDRTGKCSVRAPSQATLDDIEGFVNAKTDWIIKKQQQCVMQEKGEMPLISDGIQLPILGSNYTLRLSGVKQVQVVGKELFCPYEEAQKKLEQWLRVQVFYVLQQRVAYYAKLMNVSYAGIKLSSAAARWGSCSSKGNLNFTWRLVFCTLTALDYVVVHELSHINNMNHGKKFWQLVDTVMPDYKQRQQYLQQHVYVLQWLR